MATTMTEAAVKELGGEGLIGRCGRCLWFTSLRAGSDKGTCWRYPPVWVIDGFQRPTVARAHFCGEYLRASK